MLNKLIIIISTGDLFVNIFREFSIYFYSHTQAGSYYLFSNSFNINRIGGFEFHFCYFYNFFYREVSHIITS